MGAVVDWIIARAKEKTTWLGLVGIVLGAIGIEATSVQTETIAGALTALIGTILAIMPERK
jgi:hypothetical protein